MGKYVDSTIFILFYPIFIHLVPFYITNSLWQRKIKTLSLCTVHRTILELIINLGQQLLKHARCSHRFTEV